MIKNLFLNHKGKSTEAKQAHGTYSKAHHIGVLYNADEFETSLINDLIEQLKNDQKDVAKLGFSETLSEEPLLFSKKDISGTGTIKNDNMNFFINQSFDFLISLDTSQNVNFKYILALSKAVCKVGIEAPQYHEHLLLSLKKSESDIQTINSVVHYLKMI